MNKYSAVAIVVGMVIIAYLIILVVMPILVDFATTANATMAATSNMSLYPGTSETLVASPWVLNFSPVVIGIIIIILILKRD